MKQIKVIMLMTVACLAGCSSDDTEQTQKRETPRPMIVDVLEIPNEDDPSSPPMAKSRTAAVTTTSTLSSFSMNYMENNEYKLTKENNVWSTKQWPMVDSDQKLDFYAHTSGTFNYNNGNPYVAFSVEETVTNQHDLLVAEHKQISYNDASGHVSLSFDHACAAVYFTVQMTNTLNNLLGCNLSVTSIILRNVCNIGDYDYPSKSWKNITGSAYYTLNNSPIDVTTTAEPLSCGYLFMIPQKRAKNGITGTHLEINYTKGENKRAIIPLDIDWEAGKLHTINIKLGTSTIQ